METIKKPLIAQERETLTRLLQRSANNSGKERIRYAAEEKYGVKPGSIVEDDSGNLYRVIAPHRGSLFSRLAKPELVVNPAQKKNGDFSKRIQSIYFGSLGE